MYIIPSLIPRPSLCVCTVISAGTFESTKSLCLLLACEQSNSDAMERSSKLADLTLVSKYYPVANYSYPRNESMSKYAACLAAPPDRSSLGSEASAPGLIDDGTDSEISVDDDYQHNTHTSGIWNSYWHPGDEKKPEQELHPRKQYPALIPSPQHRRQDSEESGRQSPSWPLPEATTHRPRTRQAAATYSPFPKATPLPHRAKPASPSWENSRPRRPARDDRLLTPCLNQATSPVTAFLNSLPNYIRRIPEPEPIVPEVKPQQRPAISPIVEEPERPQTSRSTTARPTMSAEMQRPRTSHSSYRSLAPAEPRHVKSSRSLRPISPMDISRPKPCLANRPPTPFETEAPNLYFPDHHFPVPDMPPEQKLNHQRSMSYLTPNGEPTSFFEEDSDAEDQQEGTKSFFRFHKRSTSDLRRRSARSTADSEASKKRRGRTSPTPSEPPGRQSQDRKRHGVDVFGRMLGRRSR